MKSKKTVLTSAEYWQWIGELKNRYRATQIKAAVAVNSAMIEFYWNLGKDISEKYPGKKRGIDFFGKLSRDLREDGYGEKVSLSTANIRYAHRFYELYAPYFQQLAESNGKRGCAYLQQLAERMTHVPWGHHMLIIDKCHTCSARAYFYVLRTIQNGWSRNSLLNWLSTELYEREGNGQTNFALTMPSDDCDLAQQLVKDPQVFEVFGLREQYNEAELKGAIVANIERTLLSLGRLVSFVGKEYPVEIGGETKNIDLLFYIIPLHRYLVMEVKTGKYEPADLGQLSGYMVMAKHVLNTPEDNPPVGMLVCKDHNRVLAKLHLEELGLPMGITDYELKKVLPTQAQLAKCYADAEAQFADAASSAATKPTVKRSLKKDGEK